MMRGMKFLTRPVTSKSFDRGVLFVTGICCVVLAIAARCLLFAALAIPQFWNWWRLGKPEPAENI
jgi:hypothetical protein